MITAITFSGAYMTSLYYVSVDISNSLDLVPFMDFSLWYMFRHG
jgi:hypothetical protein